MKGLISIVIPMYNAERYISRCIESIVNQTYKNWELLLVNDGSTDSTVKCCNAYSDSRITVLDCNKGGVSKARNTGLQNAHGEFVYFVDADDFLNPCHLQQYIDALADSDIVFQGYNVVEEQSGKVQEKKCVDYMYGDTSESVINIIYRLLTVGNFFGPTWNKIFRREIIEKYHISFDEQVSIREDELFTFEYCQYVSSIKVLDTCSYNYQVTSNSLMRQKYRTPKELMYVYNRSYQAALQLKVNDDLQAWIDQYYSNSLGWMFWMLYYPHKLAKRHDRLFYLDKIQAWNKAHPQSKCNRILVNPLITDYYQRIRYVARCMAILLRIKRI